MPIRVGKLQKNGNDSRGAAICSGGFRIVCTAPVPAYWTPSTLPIHYWRRVSVPGRDRVNAGVKARSLTNQSYHAGDLRTVRNNSMLWPIHNCAPVRRNSSSTFWRDSTVPVVFSSSGMRFRSRSSA